MEELAKSGPVGAADLISLETPRDFVVDDSWG